MKPLTQASKMNRVHALPLDKILQLAQTPSSCTQPIEIGHIDFRKPFIHEHLTQLFYTPHYNELSMEQKLRYNQLFAIRTNEQFMFFEKDFTNRVLHQLAQQAIIEQKPELKRCMQAMIDEESKHHHGFAQLNRACMPQLYNQHDRYFNRLGWLERSVFHFITLLPGQLVFLLWYLITLEEYSVYLSRCMFESTNTALGELEPHFVHLHKEHFKDEARHIHLNIHLVNHCLPEPGLKRILNTRLFLAFIKDLITPKRSGMNVTRYFLAQSPELREKSKAIIEAQLDLNNNPEFLHSMFNRTIVPCTFEFFDQIPELDRLAEIFPER